MQEDNGTVEIPTEIIAEAETVYAGFWVRFAAQMVDWIFFTLIGYVIWGNEVVQATGNPLQFSVQFHNWKVLLPLCYFLGFWNWRGTTLGKELFRLRITNSDGSSLTFKKTVLRLIGYVPSLLCLGIGFVWIAFDGRKQGWHDKIAETVVVRR